MHLCYNYHDAYRFGIDRHAEDVLRGLGITYQFSTPQSMYDSFWFWNCENVPKDLPEYLVELKIDPFDAIGYGLTREMAELIKGKGDIA